MLTCTLPISSFFFGILSRRGNGHLFAVCKAVRLLRKAWLRISEDSIYWAVWEKRIHVWLYLRLGWEADSKCAVLFSWSCLTYVNPWIQLILSFPPAHAGGICPYRLWCLCGNKREPSSQRPALAARAGSKSGTLPSRESVPVTVKKNMGSCLAALQSNVQEYWTQTGLIWSFKGAELQFPFT